MNTGKWAVIAFVCVVMLSTGVLYLLYPSYSSTLFSSFFSVGPVQNTTADTAAQLVTSAPQKQEPRVLGASHDVNLSYDKLYALINGYRREQKLSTLAAHRGLEKTAQLKLLDMQQNHYWTHRDREGRESWYLFDQVGYHYQKAGENLSFGYTSEWKIFEEWQKSPEHNAQMLDPDYEHMGLAADCSTYAQGSQKTCVVVLHLGKQRL